MGDTYEKPIAQTGKFCLAVCFEDEVKRTHPPLFSVHLLGLRTDALQPVWGLLSSLWAHWDNASQRTCGYDKIRALERSGPRASLGVIPRHHAVEKRQAKSFHVVLYICGSIYRAWCVLIPKETFSLPALWALIAGPEGRTQHYHQARLRAAEWHFPFMPPPTPSAGQSAPQRHGTARDPARQPLKGADKRAAPASSAAAAGGKGQHRQHLIHLTARLKIKVSPSGRKSLGWSKVQLDATAPLGETLPRFASHDSCHITESAWLHEPSERSLGCRCTAVIVAKVHAASPPRKPREAMLGPSCLCRLGIVSG